MQTEGINFDNTKVAFEYKTNAELKGSHFLYTMMSFPRVVKLGTVLVTWALKMRLPVKGLIKRTLFNQFCGGESIEDCQRTIDQLGAQNVHTILDYSAEGIESEDGYNSVKEEALHVVDFASKSAHIPFCVLKLSALGSVVLMEKANNPEKLTDLEKTRLHYCEKRVTEVAQKVYDKGLILMIDAEESWIQNYVEGVVQRLMERFNRERPVIFTTYQMYRHDALEKLTLSLAIATNEGYYYGVKLVRGAYMEKERERAEEMGYKSPIHADKASVDKDYNESLAFCIKHVDRVAVCGGTHNEESSRYLAQLMEEANLAKNDPRVYFSQLLGMSDNISFSLSKAGYNVAKYVPYGPVEKVLPYLFRRAEENTSIAGQSGREYLLVKKELKRRKTKDS